MLPDAVLKRTSFLVETELLDEAAGVLGTKGPTETIRQSLEETVAHARRKALAEWELPERFPEQVEELRRPRRLAG